MIFHLSYLSLYFLMYLIGQDFGLLFLLSFRRLSIRCFQAFSSLTAQRLAELPYVPLYRFGPHEIVDFCLLCRYRASFIRQLSLCRRTFSSHWCGLTSDIGPPSRNRCGEQAFLISDASRSSEGKGIRPIPLMD